MNTRVVPLGGFGGAAGFRMFKCGSRKKPLNVGNVIVRCQDTSRARVQVVKPIVGDLSVAQVFIPGYLLPGTL